MKILHTLHWVQPGGTERLCVDLADEQTRLGFEVAILSQNELKSSANVIKFDFNHSRYNPFFIIKTAKLLAKIAPDIIHCHNTKELEIVYFARFFMPLFGSKKPRIVATKHTLRAKKRYKLADLCVAILEDTAQILKPGSIIIKNAKAYIPPKPAPKEPCFHIISATRLAPGKGMETVIGAAKLLDFDFKISIFGEGELKSELQSQINSLNLQEKVFLRGFSERLNDHLASCDLQIIASHIEAYGLTAIDGIFYSPILISTRTGVCAQILPNELIFEDSINALAAKIREIYSDYERFKTLFLAVKAKKDDFSITKMAQSYIAAYKGILK